MTPEERDQIRKELGEISTIWKAIISDDGCCVEDEYGFMTIGIKDEKIPNEANARFMAAAPTRIAALLDEVEKLEKENAKQREALQTILRYETVEFKAKTYDPNEWKTVHDLVEEVARAALEEK